ncbi:hypothetical protein ABC255_28705 [Neobacillus sp. 3P2-tot-E-2]
MQFGRVYNQYGYYVGFIVDDDRVVRDTSKIPEVKVLVPLKPIKPIQLNP